jgi:putative transposase
VVMSRAVLIASGIDWDGRRQILAVDMANRESRSSGKDFLVGLRKRGLHGVEFAVADDHAGLRSAVREGLAEAAFQRCCVHLPHATPSITCLARPTTTVCRNCAGSMTAVRSSRPARTAPHGSPNGQAATPNSSAGSKRPSRRRSHSIACRASIISHQSANMLERLNEETRRRT